MTDDDVVKIMLKKIKKRYGAIPLVNKVMSERPDLFLPAVKFSTAVIEGKSEFDNKTRYLFALAAATALGAEHCISVQLDHAIMAGANRNEVMEVMTISSMMAMTRSQSVAFRKFEEKFGEPEEN